MRAHSDSLEDIIEHRLGQLVVLSPSNGRYTRRVLYINSYGGALLWKKIRDGLLPPHHLWGCLELVRKGYEVLLADFLPHFTYRRPLPHDLTLLKFARDWLRDDDIIYCGHTLLFWLPLLSFLRKSKRHIVSLCYAREHLDFARAHSGIIGLTPAAADNARKLAPETKVTHLGWGADLNFFPRLIYDPQWFLACGKTHRDHCTLSLAALTSKKPIRVISPDLPSNLAWPPTASIVTGGQYDDTVSYESLMNQFYSRCAGSLIVLKSDPDERTAVGFTNLIEAMAMSRPVIVTRTGALPSELDVEAAGCGLHVPANDPNALAEAMTSLWETPQRSQEMGARGRQLCEKHYNIERYANDLHDFFLSL